MDRYIRLIYILSNRSNILKTLSKEGYRCKVNGEVETLYLSEDYIKNTLSLKASNNEIDRAISINYYLPNYSFVEMSGYLVGGETFRHSLFRKIFELNGGVICEFKDAQSFDIKNFKSKQGISNEDDVKFLNAMLELGYSYDKAIQYFVTCDYEFKQKVILERDMSLNKRNYYIIAGM